MKTLTSLCLASLLTFAMSAAVADDQRQQSGDDLALPTTGNSAGLPSRGLKMSQVTQRWGQPQQKLGNVGEPPITRWVYDGFTIYFEYQSVIHSVRHQRAGANG